MDISGRCFALREDHLIIEKRFSDISSKCVWTRGFDSRNQQHAGQAALSAPIQLAGVTSTGHPQVVVLGDSSYFDHSISLSMLRSLNPCFSVSFGMRLSQHVKTKFRSARACVHSLVTETSAQSVLYQPHNTVL